MDRMKRSIKLACPVLFSKKLFEKSTKAPKERNVRACGNATGRDSSLFIKPCQGEIEYSALTGLTHFIHV